MEYITKNGNVDAIAFGNTNHKVVKAEIADIRIPEELRSKHSLPDIEALKSSIREHGQITPVILRSDESSGYKYTLVAGYARIVALSRLGRNDINAVVVSSVEEIIRLIDLS